MVRVGVLGEDDELARIVGPVAQWVKIERAPERCGCRRNFDPSERVAMAHTLPSLYVGLHCSGNVPGDATVHGAVPRISQSNAGMRVSASNG